MIAVSLGGGKPPKTGYGGYTPSQWHQFGKGATQVFRNPVSSPHPHMLPHAPVHSSFQLPSHRSSGGGGSNPPVHSGPHIRTPAQNAWWHAHPHSAGNPFTHAGGGGGGGKGGSGGKGGGSHPSFGGGLTNATTLAHAMTNAQYAGVLSQLHENVTNLLSQNAHNLADIKSWYGDVASHQTAATAANAAAATGAVDDSKQGLSGLLSALGGNTAAAAPAAAMGQSGQDFLRSLGLIQAGADQSMGTDISASQASALTAQQGAGSAAMNDLKAQLAQEMATKGNSYITNLANAKQQNLQSLAEMQNMALANKQFGLNMRLGNADLALKRQAVKAGAGGSGANTQFVKLGPGDKLNLQKSIMPTMYSTNPSTGAPTPIVNPEKAWTAAANQLRSSGYNVQTNLAARAWLSNIWKNYVAQFNATHPNAKYTMAKNGTPWAQWG